MDADTVWWVLVDGLASGGLLAGGQLPIQQAGVGLPGLKDILPSGTAKKPAAAGVERAMLERLFNEVEVMPVVWHTSAA